MVNYEYIFDADKCLFKEVCRDYNKPNICRSSCVRFMEFDFLLKSSNLPKNLQRPIPLTPDKIDHQAFIQLAEIKNNVVKFVDNGDNLYIYSSNFGNGKTSWAVKLMLKYFNDVWLGNGFQVRGLFVNVPSFLTRLKANISKKDDNFQFLMDNLSMVDVVIWDDMAAVKLSDYDHTTLLTYIDERLLTGKANIYTGNIGGEEMGEYLGNRLYSRVWNNSIIIELKGNDRRGVK